MLFVGIAVVLVARPEAPPATDLDIAEQGQVVRVVDGDTIIVRIDDREESVRYIGVNAPELASVERGVDAECATCGSSSTVGAW